jgi:hypothetical protein
MSRLFFLGFLIILSLNSYAALFSIVDRSGVCSVACDLLETEVNKNLPEADQSTYLKGMANSSVASQKGLGADYATSIDFFIVGWSLGLGADLGDNSMSDVIGGDIDANQIRGFGASSALMVGFNPGMLFKKLERLRIYLHYLSVDVPDKDDLEGESTSYGFHVQYKLIPARSIGLGLLSWNGVDFTTGMEFSKMKIHFLETFNDTVTYEGITANFAGTAQVGADISTTTIPFELSTSFRLAYLLSLYGGLGLDWSFGEAKSIASVSGPITVSGGGGGAGSASLDLGAEDSPDSFNVRSFFGLQANVLALRAFAQLNRSISNDTMGVSVGVKVGF